MAKRRWLKFPSLDALRAWLRDTEDGRRIIEEFTAAVTMGRVPVLVELEADGWVTIYGPLDASVKVVQRPFVLFDDGELANLLDEYIEVKAGRRHAELRESRRIRWSGQIELQTPRDLLWNRIELAMIREAKRTEQQS